MKKARFLTAVSAAAMIFLALPAQAAGPSSLTKDFVKGAVIGNKLEIESSQRALDKSKNGAVRTFAQKMIRDHKDAERKLEDCLRAENMSNLMPTSYDRKHRKLLERVQTDAAKDFDGDYVGLQQEAHKEAVNLFTKYSQNGDDAVLKDIAGALLPTLQMHQQMAGDLGRKYKDARIVSDARAGVRSNEIEPSAGNPSKPVTSPNNPNTDRPATNADKYQPNPDVPAVGNDTTRNPTEGKSSPSGGPPN